MAQVISPGKVKLNDGKVINAQEGGWYDAQQYWGGSLSNAGQIHQQSNQQGAGQAVSKEVVQQTNPDNWNYIQEQQNKPSSQANGGRAITGGGGMTGSSGGAGAGLSTMPTQPTLNLPELYESLYASSGIRDLEADYSNKEKQFIEAKGMVNDNPFLSEGSRVGREAKLEQLFGERTANLKKDIATKKADIETKLNLETKQFDINSQQAQQAMSQFNTLLSMGALDNASADEIATLTRTTGLSSNMISSAVSNMRQKNMPTSVIQFDDGTNQGFAVINPQTGEIISKQNIGASKPSSSGSGILDESRQFELDQKQAPSYAAQAAKSGKTLKDMLSFYGQWLDPQQIYTIYNSNSQYGSAKEDKKTLAAWGIKK
jgi:hypothetical protein